MIKNELHYVLSTTRGFINNLIERNGVFDNISSIETLVKAFVDAAFENESFGYLTQKYNTDNKKIYFFVGLTRDLFVSEVGPKDAVLFIEFELKKDGLDIRWTNDCKLFNINVTVENDNELAPWIRDINE